MRVPAYIHALPDMVFLSEQETIIPSGITFKNQTLYINRPESSLIHIVLWELSGTQRLKISLSPDTSVKARLFVYYRKAMDLVLDYTLGAQSSCEIFQSFIAKRPCDFTLMHQGSLAERAKLTLNSLLFFRGTTSLQENFDLIGADAALMASTLQVAHQNDRTDRTLSVRHLAKRTFSDITNHVIATERAKVKYQVIGEIKKGMKGSSCSQINRGLLMSEVSEIESDPMLLIDEYDVSANHGASIGQINEEELFYLSSRGLSIDVATRLIVSSYLQPFLDVLQTKPLIAAMSRIFNQRIQGGTS
jgi:Fe-S cluster assembly protein SufD